MEKESDKIALVIEFYNQGYTGSWDRGKAVARPSSNDIERLEEFFLKCDGGYGFLIPDIRRFDEERRKKQQEKQAEEQQSWFYSDYATAFLTNEYARVRRILDAYVDKGCVYPTDVKKLNRSLYAFNPRAARLSSLPVRSGSIFPPVVIPDGPRVDKKLLTRFWSPDHWESSSSWFPDCIPRRPRNPVVRILNEQRLPQEVLARRLSCGIDARRVGRLAGGEVVLRKGTAKALAREFGGDPEAIRIEYELWRAGFHWRFVPIGDWLLPPSRIDTARISIGDYGPQGIYLLCYLIYYGIATIWEETPDIRRCKLCDRLFQPTKHGHGQKFCSGHCKGRLYYLTYYASEKSRRRGLEERSKI